MDYLVPSLHVSLFFSTIKRILQSLTSLIVSFVCITYIFAIIGVLIFGGLINKDPNREQYETLQSTTYGQNNYYPLNFNSMSSAFVTLICLLRVSAWDVIAVAMEKVTYPIMRLYFVLWYLIGVLFLMNTVTTLFISGFVVEAATQSNNNNNGGGGGGDNDNNLPNVEENIPQLNDNNYNDQNNKKIEKSKKVENHLTTSLLQEDYYNDSNNTNANTNKQESIDKSHVSLYKLASRLTQFMLPFHLDENNKNKNKNGCDGDGEDDTFNINDDYFHHTNGENIQHSNYRNEAISLVPKESSTHNMTTAKEGGKLYLVSMPTYSRAGNMSFESLGNEDVEVGKKFMKRIESLYTANHNHNHNPNNHS